MEVDVFINNYREAFGNAAELPIVFWYTDVQVANTEKINGCFFKEMYHTMRESCLFNTPAWDKIHHRINEA